MTSLDRIGIHVFSAGALSLFCARARAADYQITASGPLNSTFTDSSTFDGTTHGTLPPALDVVRLAGGSFTATFLR